MNDNLSPRQGVNNLRKIFDQNQPAPAEPGLIFRATLARREVSTERTQAFGVRKQQEARQPTFVPEAPLEDYSMHTPSLIRDQPLEERVAILQERERGFHDQYRDLENQKRSFNDQFSKFLQKKEDFLEKLERFESDKETFESERRQHEQQKKLLDETRQEIVNERKALQAEKILIASQKQELIQEQKNKAQTAQIAAPSADTAREIDDLTIQVHDLKLEVESHNSTHEVLQQLIDSLTGQLQQEKDNYTRAQEQSTLLYEELTTAQKDWKKKEKKLATDQKALKQTLAHYVQEREQLNKERDNFEKFKLSFSEVETAAPNPKDEKWDDKSWVQTESKRIAQDRSKVAFIKRYTEQERVRMGELKRKAEANQLQFDQMQQELAEYKLKGPAVETSVSTPKRRKTTTSDRKKKQLLTPKSTNTPPPETTLSDSRDPAEEAGPSPKPRPKASMTLSDSNSHEEEPNRVESKRPNLTLRLSSPEATRKSISQKTVNSGEATVSIPDSPAFAHIGDVFGLENVPPLTARPETLSSLLAPNEEQDFQTLEEIEGNVLRASLRCCLRRIGCLADDYNFHFTLFTVHDYFIDSVTLFKTMVSFYRSGIVPSLTKSTNSNIVPQNNKESEILHETILQKYRDRLVEALIMWMGFRFETLTLNEEWRVMLVQFLMNLNNPTVNPVHASDLKKAWNYLEEMCKQFNEGKATLLRFAKGPPNRLQLVFIDAKILADQITLEEQGVFQSIDLTEYYKQSWETTRNNITRMNERFIMMTNWFLSLVLTPPENGTESIDIRRAKTLSKLIEVMNELKKLQNFNSVMQILTALNRESVTKLKTTWAIVPKTDTILLGKIAHFMSSASNFSTYRTALDSIEENSPCIPYQSLLLTDLKAIESMIATDADHRIDFETMSKLADVFQRLQDFRSVLYSLDEDHDVQVWMSNRTILTQNEIDIISEGGVIDQSNKPPSRSTSSIKKRDSGTPTVKSPRKTDSPRNSESGRKKNTLLSSSSTPDLRSKGVGGVVAAGGVALDFATLVPGSDTAKAFVQTLKTQNERDIFECWERVVNYKKQNFGQSAMGYINWQETGEDIIATYFRSDSAKYLKQEFPGLETLECGFCEGLILPNIMDPLIVFCASLLVTPWKTFVQS